MAVIPVELGLEPTAAGFSHAPGKHGLPSPQLECVWAKAPHESQHFSRYSSVPTFLRHKVVYAEPYRTYETLWRVCRCKFE